MYGEAVCINPLSLAYTPDHLRTQEMCSEIIPAMPDAFHRIPDHFKTQEMCIKAVRDYLFSLRFIPDYFITQEQIDIWYVDDYVYNDNEMIKWYDGYQKRKAQKAKIKEELLPITWHTDRVKD